MSRINTNVPSLIGRNNLNRANASLSQALTRLSTGMRINTGKDDPAGLIASENLRSDITSIKKAIGNTDRANQVIATADSALGQVSSLLNDIRGLVTESANVGALSDAQIAANQLQVDSSLEALNRIAQTTTFQGRRLLDGSLDFVTAGGANITRLTDLKIDQANLGASGQVSVQANVTAAATKASVDVGNIAVGVPASYSTGTMTFSDSALAATGNVEFQVEVAAAQAGTGSIGFTIETNDSVEATGSFTLANTNGGTTITFDVNNGEGLDGTLGNDIDVVITDAGAPVANNAVASYNAGVLAISVEAGVTTAADIEAAINALDQFTVTSTSGADVVAALDVTTYADATADGVDATSTTSQIDITTIAGAGNDFDIEIVTAASASISDADNADGIVAGITGNAITGYTVTIANDAATSLEALSDFIAANIAEVDTAVYTGLNTDVLDLSRGEDVAPAAPTSVVGSQAAVVATETIAVTANTAAGATGNVALNFVVGAVVGPNTTAVTGNAEDGYVITIDSNEATVDFNDIAAAIQSIDEIATATYGGGDSFATSGGTAVASQANTTLTGGRDAGDDVITISATTAGAEFDGTLSFNTANSTIGGIGVTVDNGNITVSLDSTSQYNLSDIAAAISNVSGYTASLTTTNGSGTFDANDATDNAAPVLVDLSGGMAPSGGLAADAVVQLSGTIGSEVFNLRAGTSLSELINQINLVSDATGVEASAGSDGTTLELTSTTFGSSSLIDLQVVEEGAGGTFTSAIGAGSRSTGSDIVATVNGVAASGKGNRFSINTATLDLSASVEENFVGTIEFDITGGGALFQLGPDVVSNQQARLGITSVNTSSLGGESGLLYQLGSGGTAELSVDPTAAAQIVGEAIDQITSLRGRLGAFQRTTLETNKNALNDTLSNLTEAESTIRDSDFAEETANLTRSQILVQSGTRVLAIANQNPQNVLALLG